MDGKEPEIKRRFKAGDTVVFRLGERENEICPHCKAIFYDSESERRLASLSGRLLEVLGTPREFFPMCVVCGRWVDRPGIDYILRDAHTFSNGQSFGGFGVYEVELSPAPTEDGEEDEKGND